MVVSTNVEDPEDVMQVYYKFKPYSSQFSLRNVIFINFCRLGKKTQWIQGFGYSLPQNKSLEAIVTEVTEILILK